MLRQLIVFTHLIVLLSLSSGQISDNQIDDDEGLLTINIKNDGGEVYQENITANATEDIIELQFRYTDGSWFLLFIDFKSEVQIIRMTRLGERDLNESKYQVYCFVSHLVVTEFIASDAMAKLRQRNPNAIRQADEDKGEEIYEMDLSVDVPKSSGISPHLPRLCQEATNTTFARETDLRWWAGSRVLNRDIISLTSSVHKIPTSSVNCWSSEYQVSTSCHCQARMCVDWYPCSLKYCRGKDTSGKPINYRCGIKTCRKCRLFNFIVKQKQFCLWNG